MLGFLLSAVLFQTSQGGIDFKIESETTVINPARSVFLRVEMTVPSDKSAIMPDLRDRVVGFSLVEDFAEDPVRENDGSVKMVVIDKNDECLTCEVKNEGSIEGKKSVNIPSVHIKLPALSQKTRNT